MKIFLLLILIVLFGNCEYITEKTYTKTGNRFTKDFTFGFKIDTEAVYYKSRANLIIRLENKEVICYMVRGSGLSCKFK